MIFTELGKNTTTIKRDESELAIIRPRENIDSFFDKLTKIIKNNNVGIRNK